LKGKGTDGNFRMMDWERTAAYDAQNRWGLSAETEMGRSPAEAWTNCKTAVAAGRAQNLEVSNG
jgi:hypothetical protein